ncbi:MAG: acyl carrier protein [Bryobacterales bacterium]|nr:acyl carrier protein [Bryobacterales bacterium]
MLDESTIREAARAVVQSMTGELVADDEALISSGLIDSLSILKLIGQLEERLNIAIPAAQLQPDDFENVEWIVDTVGRVGKAR